MLLFYQLETIVVKFQAYWLVQYLLNNTLENFKKPHYIILKYHNGVDAFINQVQKQNMDVSFEPFLKNFIIFIYEMPTDNLNENKHKL